MLSYPIQNGLAKRFNCDKTLFMLYYVICVNGMSMRDNYLPKTAHKAALLLHSWLRFVGYEWSPELVRMDISC